MRPLSAAPRCPLLPTAARGRPLVRRAGSRWQLCPLVSQHVEFLEQLGLAARCTARLAFPEGSAKLVKSQLLLLWTRE